MSEEKQYDHNLAPLKSKLEILIKEFEEYVEENINDMTIEAEITCGEIRGRYNLNLMNIPKQFRSMTLSEIRELQFKTPARKAIPGGKRSSVVSSYASKLTAMKKQRSLSCNKKKKKNIVCNKSQINKENQVISKSKNIGHNNIPSNNGHGKGNAAPAFKKLIFQQIKKSLGQRQTSLVITPKFDPKRLLPNITLRQPKAGEIIMSLSGSPLRNRGGVNPKQQSLPPSSSSDDYKLLNIIKNISQSNNFDASKLDQKTKETLSLVQEKLARLLKT